MKLDQNTLAILSDLKYPTPLHAVITAKLTRPEYSKANAALEALGGTWSRKHKAHVFGSDAQPRVDLAIVTGEVETGADVGHFPTPVALARQLVELADVGGGMRVLEPSAGTGRIVEALLGKGADVWAIERDPQRRQNLMTQARAVHDWAAVRVSDVTDFMDYLPMYGGSGGIKRFDRVVMNPPFCKVGKGDHLDHVRHAHYLLEGGGILVSVLPSSVEFRRDKRYREFREWVASHQGTITPLPAGSFKESGTGVNTVVVKVLA